MKKLIKSIKYYYATHCWLCHSEYDESYSVCLTCWKQMRKFQIKWHNELICKL